MQITFLLGNGFDLGLGLRSRYEHFYTEYCKEDEQDDENIKAFKKMLSERNEDKEQKIIDWADFEKAFGEHSQEFSLGDKAKYLQRFQHFVEAFNAYLEAEEKKLNFDNTQELHATIEKALTEFHHIRPADRLAIQNRIDHAGSQISVQFITFNYTSTIEKMAKAYKDNSGRDPRFRIATDILHIHGYIEDGMVIGVNDPSQITKTEIATDPEVVKWLVKPVQNTEMRNNREAAFSTAINRSSIICLYGLSIGETDRKWWSALAQWLSASTERHLVILTHNDKYNPRFAHQQIGYTDAIVNRFLSYTPLPSAKIQQLRTQIHVGINHDVFAVSLRKRRNDTSVTLTDTWKALNGSSIVDALQLAQQPELLAAQKLYSQMVAQDDEIQKLINM